MSQPANSPAARDIASQIHPNTHLRRHLEVGPTIFNRGQGVRVRDDDGNDYIETVAGLWCASLGFAADERIARAAYEQMKTLGYYHGYRHQASHPAIDLAETLLRLAPVPMSKVLFASSGSEANDTAVKLCWYYHHAIGKPQKQKIIGRDGGYHGSTIGAISVSGRPGMHADFNLPLPQFRHAEMPHWYRFAEPGESEQDYSSRLAENLERLILDEDPDTVAGFFAEPVMGGGGGLVPPAGYFEKVQAVLKKYDVLFIADEVICGFGRTGNWWGSQTFDLEPDMITSAKALSAAFQPISALMVNDKLFEAMLAESDKLGSFAHGSTYAGHPVAAAVAREVIAVYEETDIVAHARRVGEHMARRLDGLADHPLIGEIRGVGLISGIELVRDKDSHALYPPDVGVGRRMDRNGRARGLILRVIGDRIVFAPPLIIDEAEVDDMVERFALTLDDTWAELGELN